MPAFATHQDWIDREAIRFSMEFDETLSAAIDKLVGSLSPAIEVLALGEPTHGAEIFFQLRNRIFEHLVEAHGYTAIALESSFPRGRVINQFVSGAATATSYEAVQESGFSHTFGRFDGNRELVMWMRRYNADPARRVKLQFYGFDSPTEMMFTDSPRQLLEFALDYLAGIDPEAADEHRRRIDPLLGEDAPWQNPNAMMDPAQSIGLSPAATALRIETENLLTTLQVRRPDCIARTDLLRFLEADRYAAHARQLLAYHAGIARNSPNRTADLLALRDAMMADNLTYILTRERLRHPHPGKVFVFAHNAHLQRGPARWQLGPNLLTWHPAGAHLHHTLAAQFANIGLAVGSSTSLKIPAPEANTLESFLSVHPALLIPTQSARTLSALTPRPHPPTSPGYFPLNPQSFTDFDAILSLASIP